MKTAILRVFVQCGSRKVEVAVPVEAVDSKAKKMRELRSLSSKALRMIATE